MNLTNTAYVWQSIVDYFLLIILGFISLQFVFVVQLFKFYVQVQVLYLLSEKICRGVNAHPDITHLHNWAKFGSGEFVKIVGKFIWTVNELGFLLFDNELHFDDDFVFVKKVHQNVAVARVEFVFHFKNFEILWRLFADSFDLSVQG